MHAHAVDVGDELRVPVQPSLLLAPVEVRAPVRREPAQVGLVGSLRPRLAGRRARPARPRQPLAQVVEHLLVDGDREGLHVHRRHATGGARRPRPRSEGAVRRHQPVAALGRGRPQLRPPRQPLLPRAARRRLHAARPASRRGRHAARLRGRDHEHRRPPDAAPPTSSAARSCARARASSTRSSRASGRGWSPSSASAPTAPRSSARRPRWAAGRRRSAAARSGSSPTRAASTPTTSRPTSPGCTPRSA